MANRNARKEAIKKAAKLRRVPLVKLADIDELESFRHEVKNLNANIVELRQLTNHLNSLFSSVLGLRED